jgi:hypothetical protein
MSPSAPVSPTRRHFGILLSPAEYGLTNPVEYLAELFACVELGLATDNQRQQLAYCLEDR